MLSRSQWSRTIAVVVCCLVLRYVYDSLLAFGVGCGARAGAGGEIEGNRYDTILDVSTRTVVDAGTGPLDQDPSFAFFVTVHESGVPLDHLQHLLAAIYYPQHWYLLHVDSTSSHEYMDQVQRLAASFAIYGVNHGSGRPNVIIMPSIAMGWGSFYTVQQTLLAVDRLLKLGRWSHFINLSGLDYIAKSITELGEYVSKKGRETNFVKYGVFPASLDERISLMYIRSVEGPLIHTYHTRTLASVNTTVDETTRADLLSRWGAPAGFTPYKGPAWFLLSRAFCRYLVTHTVALVPLIVWATNIAASDEVFFQTALFNSPFANTTTLGDVTQLKYRYCGTIQNSECGLDLRKIKFNNSIHPEPMTLEHLPELDDDMFLLRKITTAPESVALRDHLDQKNGHRYWRPPDEDDDS